MKSTYKVTNTYSVMLTSVVRAERPERAEEIAAKRQESRVRSLSSTGLSPTYQGKLVTEVKDKDGNFVLPCHQ